MPKLMIPDAPTTATLKFSDLLAGDALFTLRVRASGERFTYRVMEYDVRDKLTQQPKRDKDGNVITAIAVRLLNGPDNVRSYVYMGALDKERGLLRQTPGSKVGTSAPSWLLMEWFAERVADGDDYAAEVELWLAGRCLRCGRPLTDPASIQQFYGPVCIDHIMG